MGGFVRSVTNAVSNVVSSVVNVVRTVVNTVINVVSDVVNMVASPFMGLLGGLGSVPDAAAETARQDGVLIQRTGSREYIPVVYGYRKLGGKVIFAETGSTNNQYLWVAYVFCEGPVEGLNEVWLDDNQLSATVVQQLNAGATVDVPDARYTGRVRYQWFPGTYYEDPASNTTIATTSICKDAPSWDNHMTFNGCAVLFARYQWLAITTQDQANANPFSGNIPSVQLSIMGRKIASLRSGAGTENSTYRGSGYTERYSTNPAEILLDYLRNPRYGKGLANTDIDWDSFYIAAAKCNQTVTYSNSVTGPILTSNYVLDTGATLFSNIKTLLQNMRGYLPYIQGKYKLKIEDAGNPTDILSGNATIYHTFNKDNIVGDITYTAIDKSAKYNYVSVNWVDPDQKWSVQQTVFPSDEATRQYYITQDGGRENNLDMTLGAITNSQIAQDMARLLFYKSRYQESCSFSASAEAMELEPGDNIYIQGNILSFSTTPWRIVSLKLNNDYTVDIGCVRNPDFIYPYVTANTPDTVLAPYVPVGSTIKAPVAGSTAPVGLYPPTRAPLPVGYTPPVTPTPPTNPTQGGGVGGSTSTQNTTPVAPTVPATPTSLTDYVTIDRADYTYNGDSVYVDLTFRQPSNAQYKSLLIWFKPTSTTETVWRQVEATDRPGPNLNISYRIGPMAAGSSFPSYDLKTRVTYVTGELSTIVDAATLNTSGSLTTQDPADGQYYVTSGWTLLTTRSPGRRDDYMGVLLNTNSGVLNTATNTPDVLQIRQSTTGVPINYDITGVKYYYRPQGGTYFFERDIDFPPAQYVPGATISIGNPVNYLPPNNEGIPSNGRWDVIFKFKYNDASYSSKHIRIMDVSTAVYSPNNGFGDSIYNIENATAYPITTIGMAISTGTTADPKTFTAGIAAVEAAYTNVNQIRMNIFMYQPTIPVGQYLRGYRTLYRPKGGDGVWTAFDYIDVSFNSNKYTKACSIIPLDIPRYDTEYQIAVIPLVYNPVTHAREEAYNAIFGSGAIHNRTTALDYPPNNDWLNVFHFKAEATSAVRLESVSPPQTPAGENDTIIVKKFEYRIEPMPGTTGPEILYGTTTTNLISHCYYNMTFDTFSLGGFTKLHIYRRANIAAYYNQTNRPPKYSGLGEWEHIQITANQLAANGKQVNLRTPIWISSFNTTPGAVVNTSTFSNLYEPLWTTIGGDNTYRNFYPCDIGGTEFYVVVENTLGISKKALWLRTDPNGYILNGNVDILAGMGIPGPVDFPGTIDAGIDAGYRRRITEAINGTVPWNHIRYGYTIPAVVSGSIPKPFTGTTPSTGPAII